MSGKRSEREKAELRKDFGGEKEIRTPEAWRGRHSVEEEDGAEWHGVG